MEQNCKNFRRETFQLIKEEKWDLIESNDCKCDFCDRSPSGEFPLSSIVLWCREITPDVLRTIERIYRPKYGYGEDFWFKVIIATRPTINKLSYFFENKLIDVNCVGDYTLLGYYSIFSSSYWQLSFNYITSVDGLNINIQNDLGENVLLETLREDYNDNDIQDREEKYIEIYNDKIRFLLEKGSDPLIEDKDGISSIEYARNLTTFTEKQKNILINILEEYV
jgi:hypothetical protein